MCSTDINVTRPLCFKGRLCRIGWLLVVNKNSGSETNQCAREEQLSTIGYGRDSGMSISERGYCWFVQTVCCRSFPDDFVRFKAIQKVEDSDSLGLANVPLFDYLWMRLNNWLSFCEITVTQKLPNSQNMAAWSVSCSFKVCRSIYPFGSALNVNGSAVNLAVISKLRHPVKL